MGDSLIIGASFRVPIKKGAMETISAATAPSKGGGIPSYDWQGSGRGNCHSFFCCFSCYGEEPPTGGLAEETGQPMQGSQDSQDPKASRIPSSQSPHLERTPSPIRTVFSQTLSDKGALGDTPLSKQTGQTSEKSAPSVAFSLESESSEESSGKSGDQEEEALPQEAGTGFVKSSSPSPEASEYEDDDGDSNDDDDDDDEDDDASSPSDMTT
ncbi:ribosomal L1 domain-containing protein CG13096-like [Quercus lobata]|uniref:ribosomal L1 domain-containing protein CG13096-like n=1 Tax=Quercus lobata TaxID=97700 RepID=UPI0012448670|nr:ribosomal L1 domain-containing protein CG13096-like [Quercus lobata]